MRPTQSRASFGYTRLESTTVGSGAAELIWHLLARLKSSDSSSVTCRIDAVFDRTVHLSLSGPEKHNIPSLIVLGSRDVREGPLLITFDTPHGFSFDRLIDKHAQSTTVQLRAQTKPPQELQFHFGQSVILDVDTNIVPMLPAAGGIYERIPLYQFTADGPCVKTHVRLCKTLETEGIEDGLGWFDDLGRYHENRPTDELESLADSVVEQLTGELVDTGSETNRGVEPNEHRRRCVRADVPAVLAGLVGHGPGATPSGDDFLAGLVLTLRLVEDDAIAYRARELSRRLTILSVEKSTAMSAALLEQATLGRAAQPVVNCLETLLAPEIDVETAYRNIAELKTIGHTSGSDTLAGVLTATTVVLPLLAERK